MISILSRAKRKFHETDLLKKVQPYTLLSPGKLSNLRRLAKLVNEQGVEGDFVECGTYKGGSAAMLSTMLPPSRHLWLYDSFQGMPPVTERDGEGAKSAVGKCVAAEADVVEALSVFGLPDSQYTIREGWFKDTFKETLPQKVALLHCDADWYDSVILVLETFYSRIPAGGCIILDDFGCWEGSREAFYDFCFKYELKPLIERLEGDQAYWIKGKAHNRKQ
jgi:O-methyltransferase